MDHHDLHCNGDRDRILVGIIVINAQGGGVGTNGNAARIQERPTDLSTCSNGTSLVARAQYRLLVVSVMV